MTSGSSVPSPKVACDAMFGGLVRWLRALGVDASYTAGIEDGELVRHALDEGRIVISGDGKLFERRLFTTGELGGVHVPVGLKLQEQVRYVVRHLRLAPAFPRCTLCNGVLEHVARAEVADVVPARSLIWATTYFRCRACRHVYWDGTHWGRIRAVRERLATELERSGVRTRC